MTLAQELIEERGKGEEREERTRRWRRRRREEREEREHSETEHQFGPIIDFNRVIKRK